ncbi:hypothetical protein BH20ACT6_BH20ACT6_05450 [soil metagenome]
MDAAVVHSTGGPEALVLEDIPTPSPGPAEVGVDVSAAGVNYIDVYHRTGKYPLPTPFIAGSEGAGVVREVGADVDQFAVGDRVTWAMVPGAGYAQQVLVPAARLVPVPPDIDEETAAGGVGLLLTQVAAA